MFQFPTNGKGHLKSRKCCGSSYTTLFQFPTNGKGHLKNDIQTIGEYPVNVSISYEREGSSKVCKATKNNQTKLAFQFPTNGKGHLKSYSPRLTEVNLKRVSIPYEREGSSKEEQAF